MFGYVTPYKGELKVREYELFRGYYCGICMSIKETFGNIPRMCLNYDMTFLAILLDGLDDTEIKIIHKPCIAHPISKRNILINNKAITYASLMNLSLFYFKALDDLKDDKDIKSKGIYAIIFPYRHKILRNYKDLNDIIEENLSKLSIYEESKNFTSLDEICHPFSVIVGEILKNYPLKDDNLELKENLYNLGYSLGKWIYLIDALDDLKKDMADNKFNPISYLFNKDNLPFDLFYDSILNRIEFSILSLGNRTLEYISKLPLKRNKEILDNIINLGMMDKLENIKKNYLKKEG